MSFDDVKELEKKYRDAKNNMIVDLRAIYESYAERYKDKDYSSNKSISIVIESALTSMELYIRKLESLDTLYDCGIQHDANYYMNSFNDEIELLNKLL